jgi:hypothetical protein
MSWLILEGTASFVSLVLVLWLLLWFIWRSPVTTPIQAFFVAPERDLAESAPYQGADVRLLRGASTSDGNWQVRRGVLLEKVRQYLGAGPTVIFYVSDPALGSISPSNRDIGAEETIKSLIETIASEAKRDVILALDLAQVDSDRDLGLFGNAPYQRLLAQAKALTSGTNSFLIMTSCAPAQRSWSADGLGHSAFAFYLRKGLGGEARAWDDSEERVTSEGLFRYVKAHVTAFAATHCRAVQTPTLIQVGASRAKFLLPNVTPIEASPDSDAGSAALSSTTVASGQGSTSSPSSPGTGAAKKSDSPSGKQAETSSPKPKTTETDREKLPRENVRDDLLAEWTRHQKLMKHDPPPYRHWPGFWRHYQSSLLAAERLVRVAWHDDERIQQAREAVAFAREEGASLDQKIDIREKELTKSESFRPANKENGGSDAIRSALNYLTRLSTVPGEGAPPQQGKDGAGKAGESTNLPDQISAVAEGGFPRRFLELQLPVWAYHFTKHFRVPGYFTHQARAEELTKLVDVRAKAEKALGTDARGNRYITPVVEAGDQVRRDLQDELFIASAASADATDAFNRKISAAQQNYESALDAIDAFQKGRVVLERLGAELPELSDWSIRSRSHQTSGDGPLLGGNLPGQVKDALERLRSLASLFDEGLPKDTSSEGLLKWARELRKRTDAASNAHQALLTTFRDGTQSEATVDWISRDLALRTPLLDAGRRETLLRRVMETDTEVNVRPLSQAGPDDSADSPADTGFWARAIGLAELDQTLNRIAGRGRDDSKRESQIKDLLDRWSAVAEGKATTTVVDGVLSMLAEFSASTQQTRRTFRGGVDLPQSSEPDPDEIQRKVQLADRAVRLLSTGEVRQHSADGLDEPVTLYEQFGQVVTLDLHVRRLLEDFVSGQSLDGLRDQVSALGKRFGLGGDNEQRLLSESLRLRREPPSVLSTDKEGKAKFKLTFEEPRRRNGAVSIPKGRAFVGLLRLPSEKVSGKSDQGGKPVKPATTEDPWEIGIEGEKPAVSLPRSLLGLLRPVPPTAATEPIVVTVDQQDLAGEFDLKLEAKAFYRGSVDQSGESAIQVLPQTFGKPLVVSIAQDRQYLIDTYTKALEEKIQDQFRGRQHDGFLHKGRKLVYVLTVENVSPRRKKFKYQRFLIDSKGPQRENVDAEPLVAELDSKKTLEIRGEITPNLVSESPRELELKLTDDQGNDIVEPFRVKFRQMELKEYIEIEERVGLAEHEKLVQNCYVVTFRRRSDDKFTEPIMGGDVRCAIEAFPGKTPKDFAWFPGGPPLITTRPNPEGNRKWRWSGKIDFEELPEKVVELP